MILRAAILTSLVMTALGQAFVSRTVVTRLPLPWGGEHTNTARIHVLVPAQALETNASAPAAPSFLRAAPIEPIEVRWVYPTDYTNVTFWVYRTTNLISWSAKARFDYNIRVAVFPMIEAREFFTVCASNDAGQICIPRIAR